MVDEILLHETQKVSAAMEAPEFLDSDYDENYIYQVERVGLADTKEKLEWNKHSFECKQKISYVIENQNYMTRIHDKKVNIMTCDLLHNIINSPKYTKILNIQ